MLICDCCSLQGTEQSPVKTFSVVVKEKDTDALTVQEARFRAYTDLCSACYQKMLRRLPEAWMPTTRPKREDADDTSAPAKQKPDLPLCKGERVIVFSQEATVIYADPLPDSKVLVEYASLLRDWVDASRVRRPSR